ncbi:EamA family transporter [Agarivorans sp. MS3-6]|uniref:EamA family transporter n=1 Tax=Agarivorans sp. TSD2052 TaxID=2937286 RepID=UPI00200EBDAA|nr:EamA family transporter [Agarivorans sp. TSD2052]UPW18843.1 EamA family transporter [Agarivorans sp. TSD2052]
MTLRETLSTVALTAIAPIVWGSTYLVTTELLPANSPLTAAMLRALPAGIVLVLLTRTLPRGHWWPRLLVLGFLNIGFFFYCLFFAATHLPGGMAALVMSIQPLLVMALSYFLLNSALSIKQMVAGLMGIAGIALLVVNNQAELSTQGILMGMLGAVTMAYGLVMTKRWGRPKGMTLLGFTGWQLLLGGLMLLPVAWSIEGLPSQLSLKSLAGYSYLSIMGSVLAYSLWFRGIEKLPTITVSFLGLLSSVSAVVLGYIVLGQSLTWLQLCGALSIFVSILLAASKANSTPPTGILKTQANAA